MTFLPIVTRELRVASRRRATYWVRCGAALLLVVLGAWLLLMMLTEPPRQVAMGLFCTLTGGAVAFGLLSGVRSTSDCLSEEKREGTLGLLFLTDLKGYDVVLGKLVARSVDAFYSVLAGVPILAIPLLLGGITPGEFGRMALVALNALFFSLALGMSVSAFCRSAQNAAALTFLLVLIFTGILPGTGALLTEFNHTTSVRPFLLPSAGYSYYLALDANFKVNPQDFWFSMLLVHGLGWLALAAASLVTPRTWQERPATGKALRWRERWQLWSFGEPGERSSFRRHLLSRGAFYWLAARARLKPALVWAFLGAVACGWVWGLAKFRREWLSFWLYAVTALCLNGVLRYWFASEASRQLAEERKAGTLELLLSTPLTVGDILRGQMLALLRQFFGPVMVVLAVECLFLGASLSASVEQEERVMLVAFWLGLMMLLVGDLAASYWVGMWQGLSAKSPARALSAVLLRIWVVPWLAIAAATVVRGLMSLSPVPDGDSSSRFFLVLWLLVGLGFDFTFAALARYRLLTRFRLVAQQRFEQRPGFFKRLFGGRAEVPPATGR